MPRKRFTVEQIIHQLREAEVLLAQGRTVGEVCRQIGVSEQSYYRLICRIRDRHRQNGRLGLRRRRQLLLTAEQSREDRIENRVRLKMRPNYEPTPLQNVGRVDFGHWGASPAFATRIILFRSRPGRASKLAMPCPKPDRGGAVRIRARRNRP